jgi:hypothetical protein
MENERECYALRCRNGQFAGQWLFIRAENGDFVWTVEKSAAKRFLRQRAAIWQQIELGEDGFQTDIVTVGDYDLPA